MNPKTEQMVAYLIQNHYRSTATSLMKLSYLIDLVQMGESGSQISDFCYKRYIYGPFDAGIYAHIRQLLGKEVIFEETQYSSQGDEYIVYKFNPEADYSFDLLSPDDLDTLNEVLAKLTGYSAKTLMEITYKTKPMKEIGAKLNEPSDLNIPLNLKA